MGIAWVGAVEAAPGHLDYRSSQAPGRGRSGWPHSSLPTHPPTPGVQLQVKANWGVPLTLRRQQHFF